MDITIFSVSILSTVYFIAQFFKGLTGFGPALVSIPILSVFFPPKCVIPMVSVLNVFSGIFLAVQERRNFNFNMFLPAGSGMIIGSIIGAFLFTLVDNVYLKKLLGIIIIIFSLNLFYSVNSREKSIFHKTGEFIAGTVSGTLGGIFGTSGPVLVLYVKRYYTKEVFRYQMIFILLYSTIARSAVYVINSEFTPTMLILMGIMLPALFAGMLTGTKITKKINEILFNRIVAVMLVFVGIKLII